MKKTFAKAVAMLFVAATMLTFASCNKEDDNNADTPGQQTATVAEADILGTWLFPADHSVYRNVEAYINADHTLKLGSYTYTWTLSGNKLTAECEVGGSTLKMVFNIQSVSAASMTFTGTVEQDGVSKDISCTLIKISVPIEKLPEIIVGTWSGTNAAHLQMFADITLNADGTSSQENYIEEEGTWSLDGTTLTVQGNAVRYDGTYITTYTINVSRIQQRDGKYNMSVSGSKVTLLNGEEQNNYTFNGTMSRAIE